MKSLFKHLLSQNKPISGRLGSDRNRQKSPLSRCYPALKLLLSLPPILLMWTLTSQKALGQSAVTQLNATYTNNGGNTSGNYSIQGVKNPSQINQHKFNQGTTNDLRLTSFILSGQTFNLIKLVNRININRLNNSVVTGKRELLFYERDPNFSLPSNLNVKPSAATTMEQALLSDIINRGTDNIFGNQGSIINNIESNNNNIERVDFVETGGLVAPSANLDGIGFLVLERGANDGFKIAAITAIDAAGNPTAFGPLKTATISNWGNGTNTSIQTEVMRKDPGEANLRYTDSVPSQKIGAIYFSYQSLGVSPNQTIYGYSLFPPDITTTDSSDLVNLIGFPKDTDSTTDGGLDLIAGGGVFLRNTIPTTDLQITKTDNLTNITPGSNTTYTITVKNNGPTTVNSLTVQDTPPASLQNVQFSTNDGTYNSNTGEWTGLNLAPNQSVVLRMTATVSANATGIITNTATVSPPSGVVDSNNENNSSTDKTNVTPTADLEITKTDDLTTINPGSNTIYTITVKNNGPTTVNSLTVQDTPPASLQNVQFSTNDGTYNSNTGEWTGLNLAPNQSVVLRMTATVSANATGIITNTATVSPPSGVVDSNNKNNSSTDTTNVVSTFTISGTLYRDSDGEDDFDSGETTLPANITVRLLNASDNSVIASTTTNATGGYAFNNIANGSYKVQVDPSDADIPSNLTLGTPNNVTVTVSGSNQVVNFGFDVVAVSAKANLLLVKRITALNNGITTIAGDDLGVYLNEPSNPYDDNTLDNPAPQQPDTQFWPDPNNFLFGGVNGGNVRPGDELEYTIYFLSAGQAIAKNVLICDRIPDNVSFIPTAFNSNPPQATDGIPKADRGLVLSYNGTKVSLTGVVDGDAGVYFPPGVDPTTIYPNINCNGANTNGTVVVNLGDLPFATDSGVPLNSYGFIRFRGSVK
ncbi:SdrD B-like domain-containing protein [Anabaena azotica]|uniref:DUF11 domain-containing protein n=1 Tax=Anabaena azotica FACHB-119 TaxID=947527 RepID=A0ABR8D0K7_9NOST|nr:SdrD B-like domain-containing protein [Anabaena azotica]MBD2499298.1 DUF11 domain-containing protein [Anabaena azotica FACHB-119]